MAVETTLSGKGYLKKIRQARALGYRVTLFFLWLPSPRMALQRVAQRVRVGGHAIDKEVVERRYAAGLRNFFDCYRHEVDSWLVCDGSNGVLNPIAVSRPGTVLVLAESLWKQLENSLT